MNFLGHIYLAGDNEGLITGGFIADEVKGKSLLKYTKPIQNGIVLHREIDWFTDQHSAFRNSKSRLSRKYGHISGVIVDMFYDHFLSANWSEYCDEPLEKFTGRIYKLVTGYLEILPEKSQKIIHYMSKQNWLVSYGTFEGMGRALNGLASRISFESGMEHAIEDLKADYDAYHTDFVAFFPEIILFAEKRRQEILSGI